MSPAANVPLGMLIGVIAYILLDVGKGVQKYAIEGFKGTGGARGGNAGASGAETPTEQGGGPSSGAAEDASGARPKGARGDVGKNSGIWIAGTILTTSFMFVSLAALQFAPINLVAPLEGIGLIALLIFSYYVLQEPITRVEVGGVVMVIAGTVLVAVFNPATGEVTLADFDLPTFVWLVVGVTGGELLLYALAKAKDSTYSGVVMAFVAGTMMAFQTVAKRVTAIPELGLVFTFVMFGLATATMLLTQVAFTEAKANQVVPCFTSVSIVLALGTGMLVLGEETTGGQVAGVACVLAGILCLTALAKRGTRSALATPSLAPPLDVPRAPEETSSNGAKIKTKTEEGNTSEPRPP